jgi:hypothetical protein
MSSHTSPVVPARRSATGDAGTNAGRGRGAGDAVAGLAAVAVAAPVVGDAGTGLTDGAAAAPAAGDAATGFGVVGTFWVAGAGAAARGCTGCDAGAGRRTVSGVVVCARAGAARTSAAQAARSAVGRACIGGGEGGTAGGDVVKSAPQNRLPPSAAEAGCVRPIPAAPPRPGGC